MTQKVTDWNKRFTVNYALDEVEHDLMRANSEKYITLKYNIRNYKNLLLEQLKTIYTNFMMPMRNFY